MPDWAPKAPIQFSSYACFNHRAPDLSSARPDGPTFDATRARRHPMRNMVDAARLLRERLVNDGS